MIREHETEVSCVTTTRNVTETLYCDNCKKLIYKKDLRKCEGHTDINKFQVRYWELTTGHHDWGNDSCESTEYFAFCSPECAKAKFDEYLKDSDDGYNSMYFEMERTREWAFEVGETAKKV